MHKIIQRLFLCPTTAVTTRVGHHSSRTCSKLKGVGDDVEGEVNDAIFEYTAGGLILCNELWAREESDKEEGAVGRLHANICMDVRKAEKDWMGCAVAGHDRDVGLV